MSFISFEFIMFMAVLLLLYYLLPGKYQWMVLLGANLVFYSAAGFYGIIFLAVIGASSYGCGLYVDRVGEKYAVLRKTECRTREERKENMRKCERAQKKIMAVCLIVNFAVWGTLKYSLLPLSHPVFPLGISYYTFIAAGYCIDVYRGICRAEKNFAKYMLFLSFFPHIVQGPFSRYGDLSETLYEKHCFSGDGMREGLLRILWGIFKKTAVVGRFGLIADAVYGQELPYGGGFIPLLMISVSLRLYADFSGYMDIAAGICRMLGIRLTENFRQPFFAKSVEEIWRRWHITLGAWFRDYLFYPVLRNGKVQKIGGRCRDRFGAYWGKLVPGLIALAVVWTATGFWHGTAWYHLVWGWMNLFIIAGSMTLAPVYKKMRDVLHISSENRWWKVFQMFRTFCLFGFMEMYASSGSAAGAVRLTAAMFRGSIKGSDGVLLAIPGLEGYDVVILAVCAILMLAVDIMRERQIKIGKRLAGMPYAVRCVMYVGAVYGILILGDIGSDVSRGFMYAQF